MEGRRGVKAHTGVVTWAEPSEAVLAWVASSLGVDSARWSRRLVGGIHALTDVVRTSDTHELVLRRFPSGDDAVYREVRVLAEIAGLDGLAPLLLAADPMAHKRAHQRP